MRASQTGALLLHVSCLLALHGATAGKISLHQEILEEWRTHRYSDELLYDPLSTRNLSDVPKGLPLPASKGWIRHVSNKPRVYIWWAWGIHQHGHNFITSQEAQHIIGLAVPQMKRSTVVGQGGRSVEDNYRTSYGTFLKRYQDAVIERVENKVAAWTQLPVEHQEDIQVLRYGIGQQYKVHADTLVDPEAGVRVATVLIYLNEPEDGGETAFPSSEWLSPAVEKEFSQGFSECAKGNVAMKPKKGDALLFWSIGPDGKSEDYHASHTGCPVIRGAKWTVTKWIHAKPFRAHEIQTALRTKGVTPRDHDPGICEDTAPHCAALAQNDGCNKNRDYMVVGVAEAGACRLTCGVCVKCAVGDKECYNENRKKLGFLAFDPQEIKP